ncbi:hypothetical protein BS329_15870 [Amycolatopsis coloradensis]|uniref:SsuA/THI5-like domain-containing protein n=1 Tax=Amycolatopsis coloradensis TaxID=76021 RepID=A0A1R0KUF7_9PSEU|nr:ABC transporter substrate-binding protein [Amycolatopsis coloradensis]OLZ51738.1 hypothetical protein BS329_15870 [Amycolatopsis coloradensis]
MSTRRMFRGSRRASGRALAGAGVLVLASGCGLLGADSDPAPGPQTPVKVAALALTDVAPLHLATSHGLFAAEDLAVTLVPSSSGQDAITKLMSGDADIAYAGDIAIVTAVRRGLPLKIIAEAAVARPESMRIMTRNDGSVPSVAALAGKKLGRNAPNGVSDTLTKSLMFDHGADPNSVTWLNLDWQLMIPALHRGDIDAALLPEPVLTKAKKENLYPLIDPAGPATSAHDFPTGSYAVTQDRAAGLGAAIAGFQRAMRTAADLANTNPVEVETIATRHLNIDAGTAALMTVPYFRSDPSLPELQRVPDLMQRYGALDRRIEMATLIIAPPRP